MKSTLPNKTHIKKPPKGSVTYSSTFATDLGEYAINVGPKGTNGIRTDMLYPAIRQMEAMLSYHNKVYQIRIESLSTKYESDNAELISMLACLNGGRTVMYDAIQLSEWLNHNKAEAMS